MGALLRDLRGYGCDAVASILAHRPSPSQHGAARSSILKHEFHEIRTSTQRFHCGFHSVRDGTLAAMKVGVPTEIKNNEFRVAITPSGFTTSSPTATRCSSRAGAGVGSSIPDEAYARRGSAASCADAADGLGRAPSCCSRSRSRSRAEYGYFRDDLVLFTYLHLAAEPELTDALVASGVTAIAYETVQLPSRALPLLAPMSEVAGRLAPDRRRERDAAPERRPGPARARRARHAPGATSSCSAAASPARTRSRWPSASAPR